MFNVGMSMAMFFRNKKVQQNTFLLVFKYKPVLVLIEVLDIKYFFVSSLMIILPISQKHLHLIAEKQFCI